MPTVSVERSKNFARRHRPDFSFLILLSFNLESSLERNSMSMLTSSKRASLTFAPIRLYFFAAVLMLALTSLASAQAVGSSRGLSSGDGVNTIQGRVYFPAGEPAGKTVKLHLESNNSIAGMSAVTDQDGMFRFNSLT